MKFFGTPYMGVYEKDKKVKPIHFDNPFVQKKKLIFRFDNNGEFITDDEKLIKRLTKKFKHEEENTGLQCKKCPFTCSNKGELMAHYRKDHPKEG